MSATAAIIGKGTTLGYEAYPPPGSPAFTAIAEVYDVGFPEVNVTDVEATNYTSPNGHKEWIPGWLDGGDLPVKINFFKTVQATIETLVGVKKTWLITMPDGSTWQFPGYIKKRGGAIPNNDRVTMDVMIKVAGPATFTPAP